MFLDCFKNNGYDYLRIVEGVRGQTSSGRISNKRKTIKNLGLLKKYDDGGGEGLLLRLREQFRAEKLDIGMSYESLRTKKEESHPLIRNPARHIDLRNLGYYFIENLYNKLGISEVLRKFKSDLELEYDVLGLSKLLVYGRLLSPKSKKQTYEKQKEKYMFEVAQSENMNEVYKSLDVLDLASEQIQKRMNCRIKQSSIGRTSELMYYDVTNYYFETMYGDEDELETDETGAAVLGEGGKAVILEEGLRKRGVGKDGKANPLVAMGLFIDNQGIPVSYRIFPGNTQDKTTLKKILKESFEPKEFGRVVVVADNGLNAQENMYLLTSEKNGYIISKSVKKSWNTQPSKKENNDVELPTVREWALDESGYDKIHNKAGEMVFKSKSREYNRVLKDSEDNSITIKEKEIIFWSKKHYEKELRQNGKFIEYLESCKDNPDKLKDKQRKSQEFIKVIQTDKKTGQIVKTKAVVVLLEEKIQKQKELMGYYSLVTSETELSDKEVISRYRGLSKIEDSFRTIKSDLEGRPIYVRTKEHINAHFLICFIALTILRIIQYKVLIRQGKSTSCIDSWEQGITADNIKEALNNFQANLIGDGFYQFSEIKGDINTIFNAFDLDFDVAFPTISQLGNLKKMVAAVPL